jgi:hypothetical protein
MASKNTPIRHPSLSSKAARDALDHVSNPVFDGVFQTIDSLAALHDALAGVRANASPLQTPEANAIAYKKSFDSAQAQAKKLLEARMDSVMAYDAKVMADAHAKAGLNMRPAQADAICQALRSMTQKERDAAVMDAITRGDRVVIAAIKHAPTPLLTGTFTVPLETTIEHFLHEHTPELFEEQENIETALSFLNLAAGAFRSETEKMRDLIAEDRAERGSAAAKKAEADLQAAMRGQAPAAAQAN